MGFKEYILNPKKRQVYVEALNKSMATPPPAASKAETASAASLKRASMAPQKAP